MKFKTIAVLLLSVISLCSCNVETYSYTGENNSYDSAAIQKSEEFIAASTATPSETTNTASEEQQTEAPQQTEVVTENTLETTEFPTANAKPEVQATASEANDASSATESAIITNENGDIVTPEVN